MPAKEPKGTKKGIDERPRAQTSTVKGTITSDQRKILQKFVGILGSNEQDVVGKILTLWMYNEGYLDLKEGKK